MKFSQLLSAADLAAPDADLDADVQHVQVDSRRCGPGDCFVALRGVKVDGHAFIPAALSAGCSVVVCEDRSAVPPGVPCAVVADSHIALGRLAQAIRGWPARKLRCIAVTGTNGKSTVTYLVRAILEAAGHKAGLIGTISYETTVRSVPACNTTPDATVLAELTDEMVQAGCSHLIMEVSSHALHQRRVEGLEFDVAIFTNLTGDHMDYHHTPEHYLASKRMLFERLGPSAAAVINADDEAGSAMASATVARVLTYGLSPLAALRAVIERIDASGTAFRMIAPDGEARVHSPLIGRHNVQNGLAAAGACHSLGVPLEVCADALARVSRIPGRLERVQVDAPYQVFVDYAHTDDALKNVLSALQPVKQSGRVIVVFGCGGDRDRSKRSRMAEVAEKLADHLVITSDNPRSESPQAIIDGIVAGLSEGARAGADIRLDRREGIRRAVEIARPGDVILIAGKGHEAYQIIGSTRSHFDDVEVAAEEMKRREARS